MTDSPPTRKYRVKLSNRYKKDIRRLQKSGIDLSKSEKVTDMLERGIQLPESYRDHPLKGGFAGIRACHIAPDWLLLYTKIDEELLLLLLRTGTHRDVLGIE